MRVEFLMVNFLARAEATFMASTLFLDLKRTIQAKISG